MTSDQLKNLNEKLDRNYQLMSEILLTLKGGKEERIITVKDIAQILGVSEGYLRGDGRRFLPNGRSDFAGRKLRWKWSTWEAWRREKGF